MSPQAEKRLDFLWRVAAVAGTLFMGGVAFSGYVKLPAQMQKVEATVDSFRVDHGYIFLFLDSLQRSQRSIRQTQEDIVCLMLAEKEHRNWLTCQVSLPAP